MIISKRSVLKNVFSLSVAEIFNKGLILFTTAYLARVIKPEGLGIFGFANAYLAYFLLFATLGLSTIGTREVARNKSNINKYVNSITTLRLILAFAFYIILFASVFFIDKPFQTKVALWIIGFNLFSIAILVDWAFQGVERMGFLAIRQVVTSLLNLIGVVILVHGMADVWLAIASSVASTAINSVWLFFVYTRLYGRFSLDFDTKLWKELLKSSLPLTFSNLFIIVFHSLNILILSFTRTEFETGIYTAGEKVLMLAVIPTAVLQNTFFPLFSRADTVESREKVMRKFSIITFLIGSIVSIGFFTFAGFIVNVGFGNHYTQTVDIMKILMVSSLLAYINISYTPAFIGWNMEKYFLYVTVSAGIVNIATNFILIPMYGTTGAALASVASELVVAIGLSYFFYKKQYNRLYLPDLVKFLVFSLVSCGVGYFVLSSGVNTIISGIISIILFISINFAFKTITITELKGYFAK